MKTLALLCVGVLGSVMLAGCGDDAGTAAPNGSPTVATAPGFAPPDLREQTSPQRDVDSGGDSAAVHKEVVTGSVEITAGAPIAAAETIADRVQAAGGRIDSRTEQPGVEDAEPSATLIVRLPAAETDAFIEDLGSVGQVTRVSTNRSDVSMRWEDLNARIEVLRASVDRLRALIEAAETTSDLIDAEQALSSRQGELDSLTAQQRRLDDQVALSTLTIDITTAGHRSDDPDTFWDGIASGWNSLVNWLQDAIVFSGKAIPWLGFFAVLVALIWGIVRSVRRRAARGRATPARADTETPTDTAPSASHRGATSAGTSAAEHGVDGGKDDHTERT
ncbi:DUF4349 domain-containing protein [Nocardia sp. CNY236]|uniref:DUF4349 domain-containing protein n=1 Tax=Nocardia sp. CNY236 TaxID=1169152 RepID=UPI0003FB249D|nr:DUF4349 domain-containing protein [Nocardia sp. CNY236]